MAFTYFLWLIEKYLSLKDKNVLRMTSQQFNKRYIREVYARGYMCHPGVAFNCIFNNRVINISTSDKKEWNIHNLLQICEEHHLTPHIQFMNLSRMTNVNTVLFHTIHGITRLNLTGAKFVYLPSLQTLTTLTHLNLNSTNTRNISSLRHLTNLTNLNLYDNFIDSTYSLKFLTNLTTLNLGLNPLLKRIHWLSKLTKLVELALDFTYVHCITALKYLTNLKILNITHTCIANIYPLFELKQLEIIAYNGNEFNNVDFTILLSQRVGFIGLKYLQVVRSIVWANGVKMTAASSLLYPNTKILIN